MIAFGASAGMSVRAPTGSREIPARTAKADSEGKSPALEPLSRERGPERDFRDPSLKAYTYHVTAEFLPGISFLTSKTTPVIPQNIVHPQYQ
jgi:hypothetical protein